MASAHALTASAPAISTSAAASLKSLPKPSDKYAPYFDHEKPDELPRFLEQLEDYFNQDGIYNPNKRMVLAVKYTSVRTEWQWKAMKSFCTGTWDEFKSELELSYPAVADLNKGSILGLKEKVREIRNVDIEDLDRLMELKCVMRAEISKLDETRPRLLYTNRELVDLFMSALTSDFASQVTRKLEMIQEIQSIASKKGMPIRCPEDWFDFDEVLEIAIQVAKENRSSYLQFTRHREKDLSTAAPSIIVEAAVEVDTVDELGEVVDHLHYVVSQQCLQTRSQDEQLDLLVSYLNGNDLLQNLDAVNSEIAPYHYSTQ